MLKIIAVKNEKTAREVAQLRIQKQKDQQIKNRQAVQLSKLFSKNKVDQHQGMAGLDAHESTAR